MQIFTGTMYHIYINIMKGSNDTASWGEVKGKKQNGQKG